MSNNKKNTANYSTLTGRLAMCVEKAGGKRRLAEQTLISEAQLFRYLNGLTDLPAERVVSIAKAAGIDAGWLLTGQGNAESVLSGSIRPAFRPELMQYTSRLLDEFLIEYQQSFSPRVKSQLLTLIYEALRHEEVLHNREEFPNKFKMLGILTFMESLKTEELAEVYHKVMTLLEYAGPLTRENQQLLNTFCGIVSAGQKSYYEAYTGDAYYDRMGMDLSSDAQNQLDQWLTLALEIHKKPDLNVFDLGCGNGRHLAYLHQHYPALKLSGTDISQKAVGLCQKLEGRGKLPSGCVQQAECRELPFANNSQHMIHARHVLHYLPYVPGSGVGIEAAFIELHRVLIPQGLVCLTHFYGQSREYSVFEQLLTSEMLQDLASAHGFKVLNLQIEARSTDNSGVKVVALSPRHLKVIRAVLQKS